MLADILQDLANDTSESDGVEQLVVTALGSCGQHYICWKTRSGEYRQRSNGLPKPLQDWLFPADGSTRHFETLQVILSGENTFWASDRNGEVRSEPPGPQQRLRRAMTLSGDSFATSPRQQAGRPRGLSRGEADERPRSSTLPSASPTVDHLPGPHLKPPASHSRSSSADKLRKIALVPLAFNQQRRSWAMRPRSLVYGHDDLGVLKEQPSPKRRSTPSAPAKSPRPAPVVVADDNCTCGCHSDGTKGAHRQAPSKVEARVEEKVEAKPKSRYADACVQTDPTPDPEPEVAEDEFLHRRRRHRRRESTSSTASTADSYRSSYASSKRSSFDTITTQPDAAEYLESKGIGEVRWQQAYQPQVWGYVPNPVMMGRMQDYFRSSTYTLGAALQ
ncbi:uncharacterized protein GGS22DRAFT_93195 [Annulohypoxylon maeteangense]|uniref:uncharacterized protein n=1 Tax=Annulohypoxylon maeteangense TaxID=1927788 RepID=UPI0020074F2A|nr:uncharacterized protein GGS22DRAFT_93195 [Annulohypoxylon maeteangense]KAI0888090.1 hypothetical protein GGS22DRAFT_93195 [Annulohypoxylon maeteangense]